MPYPFVLPTTSSFSFSSHFECETHPSLPLNASTYRGVAREALKKHKRLPPSEQIGHLSTVSASLNSYIPYLLAIDAGLRDGRLPTGDVIHVKPKGTPTIKWRTTLSGDAVPGKERSRARINSIEHEIYFTLSSLGFTHVLASRTALQPLYATNHDFLGPQERTAAVSTAAKSLMEAASIYTYLATRTEGTSVNPPCVDIAPTTIRALAALAHAEATLLAVLKDDPYPAAVAQDRNKNDKEWMFKPPEIPKVRAHLYARLCLAASEHAAKAASLAQPTGSGPTGKVESGLAKYIENFRRTSRAKACRFLGIDAELGGQTADGIGWLRAGLQELGVEVKDSKKGISLSRFKKEFSERREDRRVEKETGWGADAGRLEEIRVLEMLDEKWTKINDTMNTKVIPSINSLLAKIPSGRDIHTIAQYHPPTLDRDVLEAMRALPEGNDEFGPDLSSDDDVRSSSITPIGAFPGASDNYERSSTATSSHAYF
ncbi:unnamed protein product [Clonostachys rosea f. rosea IK726]|uniref:pH-response regulator protein palC n=3 Tax=Bionectria ochroleuca TaxID=29856 RepID=A0A0B7K705_BIOOC|nr:unnamed protein product [Clonostachys rosea f. rosea IK726]